MKAFRIHEFYHFPPWDQKEGIYSWISADRPNEFIRAVTLADSVGIVRLEGDVYMCIGSRVSSIMADWPTSEYVMADGQSHIMWDGLDHYRIINMYKFRSTDFVDPLLLTIEEPDVLLEEVIREMQGYDQPIR